MKNTLLYIIVFICGAAVLAVEILGTRIIGPFYGVSIFLWSSLISITLVALSAGYFFGGRLADKRTDYNTLSVIILIPGIYLIIIPFIRNWVISLSASAGLQAAVLISSFVLFFPPLAFLGMVSPYAIKLRTSALEDLGTRAGDLYAVSTIGSVIAALLTGFFLIPFIGVIKLTIGTGILLIFTALYTFMTGKKTSVKITALVIMIAVLSLYFVPGERGDKEKGIVEIKQSAYGELKIFDKDDERYFLIDGGIHSAVYKSSGENLLPYVAVIDMMKNFSYYQGDMLLIGLGGGSILNQYYNDNWGVQAVEIDPEVTGLAYKYFDPAADRSFVYNGDGREFMENTTSRYNLIVLDAFGSSAIPFHLVTVESFKLAKKCLWPDGIIAVNVEAVGWHDKIVKGIYATLRQVFKYATVFPITEPPNKLGNVIIAASDKPLNLMVELDRNYRDPDYRFSINYVKAHAWDNQFAPDIKNVSPLTDDLNPVDIWSDRINFYARNQLHNFLGEGSFLW